MMIDFDGLDSSLEEDPIEKAEVLEIMDGGKVTVWALTNFEDVESSAEICSGAFENLDAGCSNREVINAAVEYICGRTMEKTDSFYEMFQKLEKSCTVLNRSIEPGRAAGCITNGGCAMLLGEQTALEQITGDGNTPVAVGGIILVPVCGANAGSARLMCDKPTMVDERKLKEAGCRLVEVYK